MTSFDILTGLQDRQGCLRLAEVMAATAGKDGAPFAALWVDIDRFRQVNESFGHLGGDEVIRVFAQRFRIRLGGRGELGRMGGDEFVLLAPRCDCAGALGLADEILRAVEEPIVIGSLILHPTASIGVAIHEIGEGALELLDRADRAKMAAKKRGGANIVCSGDEPIPGRLGVLLAREELEVESGLHFALENGGLSLHYQPIVEADGRVSAVEALMRCSVNGSFLSPARFIPVAEKTGLIIRLGEWCLLQGALFASHLQQAGHDIRVAVNVSRAQLASPKFSQALHAALICSNAPPGRLELELTESLFMDVSETVQKNVRSAISAGVRLAIDDFGTGYSCLANLKDIPATKLKLDRAFVTVLPEDRRAYAVIKAIRQLGHELGMTVVAEGCEKKGEADALLEAGVDAIQGYYYAKPMSEDGLMSWLAGRNT